MTVDPLARMATYDQVYGDRTAPEATAVSAEQGGRSRAAPARRALPRLTFRPAALISPGRPTWLWPQWLEAGALHLLIGRQGGGKSTFAAWVVAQLTRGRSWPDTRTPHEAVTCAVLSLEENAERLVARLHAAGADLDRVLIIDDIEDQDEDGRCFRRPWQLPSDCDALERLLTEHAVGFVTVDGLGYSVRGDSHNYAVVGSALSALAKVGERSGAAILGLTHPPKGSADPVTAAIGSTAWTAIPRVTWVLGADPEDESGAHRVVRVAKSNHRQPEDGVGFTIGNDERCECGFVDGLTASKVSAEDLVAAASTATERTERDEAREMVRSILLSGSLETRELLKLTREAGISDRTVTRARKDLGVVSVERRDPVTGRLCGWQLSLPDNPPTPQTEPVCQPPLGTLGTLGTTRTFVPSSSPECQPLGSGALDADDLPPSDADVDRWADSADDEECAP